MVWMSPISGSNEEAPEQKAPLAFMSRLPTEIMEAIFIRCARDYFYYCYWYGCADAIVPAWVHISYVCREWRRIALNCAAFWTYHFVVSPRWTDELLSRSKDASLRIHLPKLNELWQLEIAGKVMDHIERIEELALDIWEDYFVDVLSRLSSPARRLQILEVSASGHYGGCNWTSVLFNGDTPALHTLDIACCSILWHGFMLGELTTLKLFYIPEEFRLDMENLLATLTYMPGLVHLSLEDAIISADDFISSSAFHTSRKVDLPHLSRLCLDAPLSTVVTFLSCVNVLSETKLRLVVNDVKHHSLLNVLSSFLMHRFDMTRDHTSSLPTIRAVNLECHFHVMRLKFNTLECERRLFATIRHWDGNYIPLDIRVDFSYAPNHMHHFTCDVIRALPPMYVHSIHVSNPPLSPTFWRRALGHLRDLTYVMLSQGDMPNILALSHTDLGEDAQGEGRHPLGGGELDVDSMVLPALKEFDLEEMTFSEGDDPVPAGAITLQSLFDGLSSRKGLPGRLMITRCRTGDSVMSNMIQPWGDIDG